ncbi:MAG: hypothetical protein ACPGUF_03635 [Litorivicinus sp.]
MFDQARSQNIICFGVCHTQLDAKLHNVSWFLLDSRPDFARYRGVADWVIIEGRNISQVTAVVKRVRQHTATASASILVENHGIASGDLTAIDADIVSIDLRQASA